MRPRSIAPRMSVDPTEVDGRFDLAGWHLLRRLLAFRRVLPGRSHRLLDLGMGRGRDDIYLSKHGFRVTGIDLSSERIRRARRRADREGIPLRTRRADLRDFRLPGAYDAVFSSTFVNHLPREIRRARFAHFRAHTTPGGIHAVNAFVRPVPGGRRPEVGEGATWFRRGELRGYYSTWELLESGPFEFECLLPGPPHRHRVEYVLARRPSGGAPPQGPGLGAGRELRSGFRTGRPRPAPPRSTSPPPPQPSRRGR
jgi:tellurite methyltransferase